MCAMPPKCRPFPSTKRSFGAIIGGNFSLISTCKEGPISKIGYLLYTCLNTYIENWITNLKFNHTRRDGSTEKGIINVWSHEKYDLRQTPESCYHSKPSAARDFLAFLVGIHWSAHTCCQQIPPSLLLLILIWFYSISLPVSEANQESIRRHFIVNCPTATRVERQDYNTILVVSNSRMWHSTGTSIRSTAGQLNDNNLESNSSCLRIAKLSTSRDSSIRCLCWRPIHLLNNMVHEVWDEL